MVGYRIPSGLAISCPYIPSKIASAALPQLEAERSAIESEIGEKLEWNGVPGMARNQRTGR
jgi:hypothetical protein